MEIDVTKFKKGDLVGHYIFGDGTFEGKKDFIRGKDGFSVTFGNRQIFFYEDGKTNPEDVRHGFIKHTPVKRKKTAEVDIWVNVYKGSSPDFPSTQENHFVSHPNKEHAIGYAESLCISKAVPSKLIVGEWEE